MKNLLRIPQFVIIITLSIFTISCTDDDDDNVGTNDNVGNPNTEEGTLSATVDGVDKTSVLVSSFEASFGSIAISGLFNPNTNETLGIQLQDTTSTGTYDLSKTFGHIILTYSKNDSTTYVASHGTLTLLVNDTTNNKLEGTFNFIGDYSSASDSVVVEEGKFNTTY